MGRRLVVDLELLERTAREVDALRAELEAQPDIVDEVRDAVGNEDLSDALGDFAGNWSYHRRKLTGSLDTVARMSSDSAEVYRATDARLASARKGGS